MRRKNDLVGAPTRGARSSRIISLMAALALGSLLTGCTMMMKLAYNQAPELVYWQLDSHFDLTEAQSMQVKADLGRLHAWHRQTQLPGYIDTLQKLQQQTAQDMDAGKACALFGDMRGKLLLVSQQAEPVLANLAGTLEAKQMQQLQERFDKGNAEYRKNFLESASDSRKKRYKDTVKRAEMLYGRLEEKQLQIINRRLDASRFNAEASYQERLRRQRDALQTLQGLANQSGGEKNQAAIRGLFERTWTSPDPAYRDYLDQMTQDACQGFAELHNSTSTAQRARAAENLQRYGRDFRALQAQNGRTD